MAQIMLTAPKVLELPQEICDHIMLQILRPRHVPDHRRLTDIKALRLVCRSLASGFLPYLINLYQLHNFPTLCGARQFTFFLDDEGINDIEWLSQSRLARYVKNVLLADRVPASNILATVEVAEDEKSKHRSLLEHGLQKAMSGPIIQDVTRRPVYYFANGVHYNASAAGTSYFLEYVPIHASSRGQHKWAHFDAEYSEWKPEWDSVTCSTVRALNLQASASSLQRLATALSRFSNLVNIDTNKLEEIMAYAQDSSGLVVDTATFHGGYGWTAQADAVVKCSCGGTHPDHPGYGCALKDEDIAWPAILDLAQLLPMLPNDLPMFSKLTTLRLHFYDGMEILRAVTLQTQVASNLASFIARCDALEDLSLRCGKGWFFNPKNIVKAINETMVQLGRSRKHFLRLRSLRLVQVNPVERDIVAFLVMHATTLQRIDFSDSLEADDARAWAKIFLALSQAPQLRSLSFELTSPNKRWDHDTLRKALDWVNSTADLKRWLSEVSKELQHWDGRSKRLILKARSI